MQQEPIDWRYRFQICWAYFSGLNFRAYHISPQNMAKHMVLTYLHFRILKFPLIPVTIEGDVISNGCFRTVLTSFWVDDLPFYRGCNHQPPTIYQLQLGWCTWYPDLDPEHHTLPGKSFLRPRWIVRRLLAWCVHFFVQQFHPSNYGISHWIKLLQGHFSDLAFLLDQFSFLFDTLLLSLVVWYTTFNLLVIPNWLVLWNMTFIFPYIVIIPSDEVIFFRGVGRKTTNQISHW